MGQSHYAAEKVDKKDLETILKFAFTSQTKDTQKLQTQLLLVGETKFSETLKQQDSLLLDNYHSYQNLLELSTSKDVHRLYEEKISKYEGLFESKSKSQTVLDEMNYWEESNVVLEEESMNKEIVLKIDDDYDTYIKDYKRQQNFLMKISKLCNIPVENMKIKKISKGSVIFHIEFTDFDGVKVLSKFDILQQNKISLLHSESMQKETIKITFQPEYDKFFADGGGVFWNNRLTDKHNRGSEPYYCPVGWTRFGIKSNQTHEENFHGKNVVYVGSYYLSWNSIINSIGLFDSEVFNPLHRNGIVESRLFCSPSIKLVAYHSPVYQLQDKYFQVLFQCRVDPKKVEKTRILDQNFPWDVNYSNNEKIMWYINKSNSASIYPYGIMIRGTVEKPVVSSMSL